jgi:hypothetical protein
MTITTQMIWTMPDPSDSTLRQRVLSTLATAQVQIDAMVAAGQTDGIKVVTLDSPVIGEVTAVRTWIDTAAAQEWIDFIIQYGQYEPISTIII